MLLYICYYFFINLRRCPMKVLWLGQGGLLFVSGKSKIMIDPYLTNSLSKSDRSLSRRMKVNKKLFKVKPDIIILTNNHPDHADFNTIEKFVKKQNKKKKITILSSENTFNEIVHAGACARANNILFEEGSEWTIGTFHILAVHAKTDDRSAFGVIITDRETEKKYYVAGDTLYSKYVLQDIPEDIYAAFLPINGEYGSMNMLDAQRFAFQINAEYVVPVHFGMFDKIDPYEYFVLGCIVPKIYKIIDFEATDKQMKPVRKNLDHKFNEKKLKEKSKKDESITEAPENNESAFDGLSDFGELEAIAFSEASAETKGEEQNSSDFEEVDAPSIEDFLSNEQGASNSSVDTDDLDNAINEIMKETLTVDLVEDDKFEHSNENNIDDFVKVPDEALADISILESKDSDNIENVKDDTAEDLRTDNMTEISDIEDIFVDDTSSQTESVESTLASDNQNIEAEPVFELDTEPKILESINEASKEDLSENVVSFDGDDDIDQLIDDNDDDDKDDEIIEIVESDDDDIDAFIEDDISEYKEKPVPTSDDASKIDAYIKEIEKFQRGETADFSKVDDN